LPSQINFCGEPTLISPQSATLGEGHVILLFMIAETGGGELPLPPLDAGPQPASIVTIAAAATIPARRPRLAKDFTNSLLSLRAFRFDASYLGKTMEHGR